jgi:Ca-dependent carbohydrate-binding module xylan-binding/Cellulase (glycosyl hydrolase family 5)
MATSSFTVAGGQILDPSGQPFIAKGINIYADVLMNVGAATITSTLPGLNFLRVNVFDMTADTAATLKPYVDALTSQGVVVELEDHNFPTVLTGNDLNYAVQRYGDWAATFKGNSNVVFGTQNEPDLSQGVGAVTNEISAIYNAVRATGNNTLVLMNEAGGWTTNGFDPSVFSGMTNVAFDAHYYNWISGNSTDLATNQSALANEIAGSQSIKSANGTIPVIIGEYGNAAAAPLDPGWVQVVQAVDTSGYGSAAWAWQSYNTVQPGSSVIPADLVNPPWTGGPSSLTPYGQMVAQYLASGTPPVGGGGGPPPATTTGTGSDTLILNVTEDAYQGNAQFTVAIDGKQLGGTFTAVGSHAAGTEQSFTFKGDWAPGAHSVAVNFLNDASGGTPTTDRNLYVDKVTYDGASSGQTLQLYSGGPQSFALTDTTAIPMPSPDGTKITTAAAKPIVDQAGNAWTLVQSATNGLQIAVNGTVDPITANVVLLETTGGKIEQENAAGNWYSIPGPGGAWTQIAAPVVPPVPSPDGTKITTAAASPIIDQSGNAWTLVQSTANGLQIAVNGTVDPITANVVLLETTGGKIEQENAAGTWYTAPGPGGAWTQIASLTLVAAPVTTGTGSDTLVLGISEDAYQGDAQFTVSVDGKQLAGTFTTTASHTAAASQSFTFKGDWAAGTHAVAVNFLNDAYGGTAATDRNLYVNTLSYDGTATGQSAALLAAGAKSFNVTDMTAVPSAAIGSGSDALVLSVSEDAYLGNAQFTVSVDGKQLGGTFTATASHAATASQSFTFNGDFGTGSHAVAVNFLNDAYGGTAATDRNLYVNGITYGGTATGQSATLLANGTKAFTVAGGTTPSVSETGDHGSLTKGLSQTGTYTVGGDTFVLSTGNAAAVTLGTGVSQIKFIGAGSLSLTGGSGSATVTADAGANKFVAGTGALDVTGGGGKDAYVFHANGGLLKIEDFSIAKGDTLTVDKALQGAMQQASDGQGGTMLTFGAGATHGVDIHGMATMPTTNVLWA